MLRKIKNAIISVSEKPEPIANTPNADVAIQTSEPPPNLQIDEDELYQQAFEELENDEKVVATWSRSFAEAGGDEQKAKALYIQHRVEVLKTKLVETYKQELAEAEKAKEKAIAEEKAAAAKAQAESDLKSLGLHVGVNVLAGVLLTISYFAIFTLANW